MTDGAAQTKEACRGFEKILRFDVFHRVIQENKISAGKLPALILSPALNFHKELNTLQQGFYNLLFLLIQGAPAVENLSLLRGKKNRIVRF